MTPFEADNRREAKRLLQRFVSEETKRSSVPRDQRQHDEE
jgi:hypothetical protein